MPSLRRVTELAVATCAVAGAAFFAAVPRLVGVVRPESTESFVAVALADVAAAQAALVAAGGVDRDGDGRAEVGGFAELVFHGQLGSSFARRAPDGAVDRGDYRYRLWLPARGGGFVAADAPGAAIDAERARAEWRCYAWPVAWRLAADPSVWDRVVGRPGTAHARRAFCVDGSGIVRAFQNADRRYAGTREPAADAAFGPERDAHWVVAGGR